MKSFRRYLAEERINPQTYNISGLYHQLNRQLFDGKLPDVPVEFGKVPKGAGGVTISKAMRLGRTVTTTPGTIRVAIKPYGFEEDTLKGILAHEMVHVYNMHFNRYERESHGLFFQSVVSHIQPKASFPIPRNEYKGDDEEHSSGAVRDVAFIAGVNGEGKKIMQLLSKSSVAKPDAFVTAQGVCDVMVSRRGWKWAAYGLCKTGLGNTYPVSRDVTGGRYIVPSLKPLGVQRILYMNGTPDFS